MKAYLHDFIRDYPPKAKEAFAEAYERVQSDGDFLGLLDAFYKSESPSPADISSALDLIAERLGVHVFTMRFLYFALLSEQLKKRYQERNLPESVFIDSMGNIAGKVHECFINTDIWGIRSFDWQVSYFLLTRFRFGRLDFDMGFFAAGQFAQNQYTVCGNALTSETKVINIHIPLSKMPFTRENRFAAYDKAWHFFNEVLGYKTDIFSCGTWILYHKNKEILDAKSNIVDFSNDFKILFSVEAEDPRRDMWRIFGRYADLPAHELPKDTSLQRAYADFFAKGNRAGLGKGVFVWDPATKKPLF